MLHPHCGTRCCDASEARRKGSKAGAVPVQLLQSCRLVVHCGCDTQVAAQLRHWRPTDASKSPTMHAAHRWLAGEAEDLTVIDPVEILADLADDASVVQVPAASLANVY